MDRQCKSYIVTFCVFVGQEKANMKLFEYFLFFRQVEMQKK